MFAHACPASNSSLPSPAAVTIVYDWKTRKTIVYCSNCAPGNAVAR